MPDALHYLSLSLCNVRAFGGRQVLDLSKDGKPSRWCVIIGENGVGKTTLMQALAAMRPVAAFGPGQKPQSKGAEADKPLWAEPALTDYENARIEGLARRGESMTSALEAVLVGPDGKPFSIGYDIDVNDGELQSAAPKRSKRALAGDGPFVIGYSAIRHHSATPAASQRKLADYRGVEPTEALFDDTIGLLDPNEVVADVDYSLLDAMRDDKNGKSEVARLQAIQKSMTAAVAALIPGLTPEDVTLEGRGGIRIKTPSGDFPLAKLSFGAQTTVAWVLDLAWRLRDKFETSPKPFAESAIVLIDEVELHLHPTWQRSLRKHLLHHFPNIQFIVTTHAPVTAQESVAAGDPISIVRWEGDHAVIVPDPFPPVQVRLDEVATGLFELETSLPTPLEELLRERRGLIKKVKLSNKEKERLVALNEVARAIRTGDASTAADVERLMAAVPNLAPS